MNPESDLAYIAFEGDRRIGFRRACATSRARPSSARSAAARRSSIFDGATSRPIDLDFRGSIDDVLARLPQLPTPPAPATPPPRGAARTRPAETRRGRARGDAVAAALGMAGAAARRRLGGAAQAGRRSAARQRRTRTGSAQAQEAAYRFMAVDGRQRAALRGSARARCSRATRRGSSGWIAAWPADIARPRAPARRSARSSRRPRSSAD